MQRLCLIILVIFSFTYCKKNETDTPPKKYRLKEYTEINFRRVVYLYDTLNRIIKVEEFSGITNELILDTRYFYANAKLDSIYQYYFNSAYKYEKLKYINDTIESNSYNYVSSLKKDKAKYVKHNNQIETNIIYNCIIDESLFSSKYEKLYWDEGNLLKKDIYNDLNYGWSPYIYYSRLKSEFELTNTVTYEYDKYSNPFCLMNEQLFFGDYRSSKNNLLRMIITNIKGDTLIHKFTYSYNENGLPIHPLKLEKS